MMDKHDVAHVLEEIGSLLELKGENAFKIRAFQNAARTVGDFTGDLAAALASGEFAAVKGIGPATLDVVRECLAAGRSEALATLRAEVPPGLVAMLRVSGMGATKVRAVHEQLGIATLDELEVAARDGRLAQLPRFGEKTAAKILKSLEFLRRTSAFSLAHHAARRGEALRAMLAALPGIAAVEVAGSVRRRCEVVQDVDLAVAATVSVEVLADHLVRGGAAIATVSAEPNLVTVRLNRNTTTNLHRSALERFGHRLVWATGSPAHLEQLRRHAATRGLVLDAAGLTREGAPLDCPDEAAFYDALGLAWIPPELREGADEVARAAAGPLPRLVEQSDLRGLLHCHTTYSDGLNSVAEMAEACRALGYEWLGITDHSQAAAYAGGLNLERVARQHAEIDAWNRASPDLRILKGIEADILADGRLDYSPEVLDRFDFVIGSIHSRFELDGAAMTARVLRALDDPHLTILGHPTGRLLLTRDPYEIDMHQIIARAAERGVAIEINADPQRLDLDWRLCREARDAGVAITIAPDAHSLAGLQNVEFGVGIARKGWLEPRDILNTRDGEEFLRHAKRTR
jgi:DNA polymerase (family 10)